MVCFFFRTQHQLLLLLWLKALLGIGMKLMATALRVRSAALGMMAMKALLFAIFLRVCVYTKGWAQVSERSVQTLVCVAIRRWMRGDGAMEW